VFAGAGARAGSPGQASGPGFTLREVSAGPFFARVAAAGTATGAFAVSVGLAGDVTGDQRVDAQDLDLIRSLHGRRAGQDGFVPAADVNHNGVIGPGDVTLARRNLGKAAVVGPLTADHVFLAGSDALGLKAAPANPATQPRITLVLPDLSGATINPSSFSWGIQAVTDGSGGGTGKPIKTDLAVTMKTGPASPLLFDAVVRGTLLRDATLYVGRRGGTPGGSPVLRWDMADVVISSYQTGGTGGASGVSLAEAATLNFGKLQITFWPTLPNGQAGDPVKKGWDFVLNRPWDGPA
jgi:type VI protein secretion system component Hcp